MLYAGFLDACSQLHGRYGLCSGVARDQVKSADLTDAFTEYGRHTVGLYSVQSLAGLDTDESGAKNMDPFLWCPVCATLPPEAGQSCA